MIALTLALVGSIACGESNQVEGQVADERFSLSDAAPELKIEPSSGDAIMVLAEEDGEKLRTFVMEIPGDMELLVGEPIAVGPETDLFIELSVGDLEVFNKGDVRVLNSKDTQYYDVVSGTVIFDSLQDPVSGWFSVTLKDGSVVEGFFSMDGSLR